LLRRWVPGSVDDVALNNRYADPTATREAHTARGRGKHKATRSMPLTTPTRLDSWGEPMLLNLGLTIVIGRLSDRPNAAGPQHSRRASR
jgi:hypothetical protein